MKRDKNKNFRALRHPLRLGLRGWQWGKSCIISPRGTVFETRSSRYGLVARRRLDFQLNDL